MSKAHVRTAYKPLRFESLENRQLLSAVPPLDFLDRFVPEGSGRLNGAHDLTFGPDVNGDAVQELYVSSANSDAVLRYDGATGAPLPGPGKLGAEFISSGSGVLDLPGDLAFGPDNNLYVSSSNTNQVLRYDGSSGAPLGVVVSGLIQEPGIVGAPFGLTFGSDGSLYIANEGADEVLRYDGTSVTPFVTAGSGGLDRPRRAVFGPDGNLYVNSLTRQVLRYDGETGAFIDVFATTNLGGRGPAWLEFGADGYLYITGSTTSLCCEKSIVRFNGTTGEFVDRFDLRRDGWAFTLHHDPTHGVVVYNASNGYGNFVERFVSSTNPDPTKFYVVDDGDAVNKTYEYGSGAGAPSESYPLVNNNAAPRGSAVWGFTNLVVDVNKNVYVYSPHGELLGSWLAGGLDARAQLEGVAVHSGVVWLVDTQQDKVYRYTNAAARLSGTQNASSYFNLNTANTNPKDIVTDGTYLWVVDDSQTDKVFKYELDGALVGSWTISTPDASNPTGITLDRGNPDHLWIVDAASDRVPEYQVPSVADSIICVTLARLTRPSRANSA
jgi:sugar lactone lactonase YvrE